VRLLSAVAESVKEQILLSSTHAPERRKIWTLHAWACVQYCGCVLGGWWRSDWNGKLLVVSWLQLYGGWSQCVGAIFAIKWRAFICINFASYASWKWCGRKFYQIYSSSIESYTRTIYK
jgi:hypothetical protein